MTDASASTKAIGPYPIEREIGRGGMGIVYLGRDTRLDRRVAIKVLPDVFAADPERLARFEREARLLASLNHPNIAAIYGLEEANGRRFLVLEYVEGETLAERVARGPLPIDDAVDVGRQIAAALEAAHESGVIHRDLKPGNVKLTPGGDVKVLDFGLAKGGATSSVSSDPSISASPTMSHVAATSAGVILGTAAYMSPEQARARAVDRRTDIWSFGCVLYECLTGRQAFTGETVSDLIAVILQGEPDWKALPAGTPTRLRELLARCLTKDPKKRLRDIGEARLLLEGGDASQSSGVFASAPAAAPARASRLPMLLAAAFALTTAVLAALLLGRAPEALPVQRLSLDLPTMVAPPRETPLASLSPDGTMIASSATDSAGTPRLWLRSLDALQGRLVPTTEDCAYTAWSPDGHSIAFATQDRVKKVDIRGGAPEVVCPIQSYGRGLSWGSRNTIVFCGGPQGPVYEVSADGGEPRVVTTLGKGETAHRFPRFLPDGRHFLYAVLPGRRGQFEICVGSTDDAKTRQKLFEADGVPTWVEPGWLLFARNGRLLAQRFDANSRRLGGKPIMLSDEPKQSTYIGGPAVTAGRRGAFAYFRPEDVTTRLVWGPPAGPRVPLPFPPGAYGFVLPSPSGEQAVVSKSTSPTESDLWLIDLHRMIETRFTFDPGAADRPVWSPDGARIAYSNNGSGRWEVYVKDVGAAGAGRKVFESIAQITYPDAWTPDGRVLLVEQIDEKTGWNVLEVPLEGGGKPRPILATAFDEQAAALSHDGRWLAYSSNESGRGEIYVDSYPVPGHRTQITNAGGLYSQWRPDGRELAVLTASFDLLRVPIDPATGRVAGPARTVALRDVVMEQMMPDFQRAIAIVPAVSGHVSDAITIVDNWRSALKER